MLVLEKGRPGNFRRGLFHWSLSVTADLLIWRVAGVWKDGVHIPFLRESVPNRSRLRSLTAVLVNQLFTGRIAIETAPLSHGQH